MTMTEGYNQYKGKENETRFGVECPISKRYRYYPYSAIRYSKEVRDKINSDFLGFGYYLQSDFDINDELATDSLYVGDNDGRLFVSCVFDGDWIVKWYCVDEHHANYTVMSDWMMNELFYVRDWDTWCKESGAEEDGDKDGIER